MFAHRPSLSGSFSRGISRSRRRRRHKRPKRALTLETLESRFLMSVAPADDPLPPGDEPASAQSDGGMLPPEGGLICFVGDPTPDTDPGENDDGGSAPGEDTGGAAQPPGATPTPPTAVPDAYDLLEDETLVIDSGGLLANDTPASEGQLTAVLVEGPQHGTLLLNPDGTFTYTPQADFFGTDTFTYRGVSGDLESDVVSVTLIVAAVNDSPNFTSEGPWLNASEIDEGGSVTLAGSFTDPEGGPHQVLVDWGDGSTSTLDLPAGTGNFELPSHRYADDPSGPNDVYTITVSVVDVEGAAAETSLGVTVHNVGPDLQVSGNRIVGVGGEFTLNELAGFVDPGGAGEQFTCIVDWGDGTVETIAPDLSIDELSLAAEGKLGGTHRYDEAGTYTVTVTVDDGDGGVATGQLEIDAREDLVDFVVPTTGVLRVKCLGGSASAKSSFSIGTSPERMRTVLRWLPRETHERAVGLVREGQSLHFAIRSRLGDRVATASSSGNDFAALEAFTDRNGSLELEGAVIEQTGENTWVLHLDDPVGNDDDDNDVQIQLRIQPIGQRHDSGDQPGDDNDRQQREDQQRRRHRQRPSFHRAIDRVLRHGRFNPLDRLAGKLLQAARQLDADLHAGRENLFGRLSERADPGRAADAALADLDLDLHGPDSRSLSDLARAHGRLPLGQRLSCRR